MDSQVWGRARTTLIAHWRAVAIGLALTLLATGFVALHVQATYTARASVLLLPPAAERGQGGQTVRINPYRTFDDSLRTTATVLTEVLGSDTTKASFQHRGLSTDYSTELSLDDPMLTIEALSGRREVAGATRDALIRRARNELERRQAAAGAPIDEWITSSVVTHSGPSASSGARLRVGTTMLVLGGTLAIAFPFLVDALRERRIRTKAPPAPAKAPGRKSRTDSEVRAMASAATSTGNGNGSGMPKGHSRRAR
jgi:hypothetical protein